MYIRKRDKVSDNETSSGNKASDFKKPNSTHIVSESKKKDKYQLSLVYWGFLSIYLFVLFDIAIRFQSSCDFNNDFIDNFKSASDKIESTEPAFNDTLARQHLQAISRLGSRPAGSTANEIHTPSYILKYVREIVDRYSSKEHHNLVVSIDEHISQLNSFNLIVFGKYHLSSVYDGLRSIAIRIHDSQNNIDDAAVMINCHYDSFFGGIGASDDLASCTVMLETLHALLKHQPLSLRSDIILLFNGAEENILQASHAFVTQHRWAKHVKLVVNLEAAGSGGRQMIFQASAHHPWIVSELGRVMKQPFASVIGQEIFAANWIPSDTDYRIFRDVGQIPGVDLAFISNGYIYHTCYDTEDRIPQACLRHTGDNLLKVVLHLANVDFIAAQSSEDSIFSSQRVVFYDFLGLILISYTELTGLVLNCGLLLVSVALIICHAFSRPPNYIRQLSLTIANQFIWVVTNVILSALLGYLIHRFGYRMSWYSIRYNIIGLFLTPLLWYFFVYHHYISNLLFRIPSNKATAECHRHACIILISIFTVVLTMYRLLSCYFISMWLVFSFVNELISNILNKFEFSEFNKNVLNFIRDAFSYTLPLTYYFYMMYTLYDVFVPILGRTGPSYPDLVISVLTGVSIIIPGLLFAGNVYVTSTSSKRWLTFLLLHFSISYYIFIHSTQFGFPYNQSEVTPRKQRIFINHVTRNIRNRLGQTQLSESGLWVLSLDTNNVAFLKTRLQDVLKIPMQDIFCEMRPYCGFPILFPFATVIDNSLWIPQPGHKLKPPASIFVVHKVSHISGMVNVTFQVSGPTHSPMYIMTPDSMRLISWSLGPDPPQPIEMPSYAHNKYRHYFIFYGYGEKPASPLKVWITFLPKKEVESRTRDPSDHQIEVALGAHYLQARTEQIDTLLHLMPKWTVPTSMASSYEHIVVDFDQQLSYDQ